MPPTPSPSPSTAFVDSATSPSPQIHPLMPPSQAPITPAIHSPHPLLPPTPDTSAATTISVDNITADDIINATEAAGTVAITGSVGGDAAQGDTVSFTINGTAYSGTVDSSSNFSIDVAGSDLAADTSFDATVTGTDNAGIHSPPQLPPTPLIPARRQPSPLTTCTDDIINATEAAGTVAVTGSCRR